MLRFFTRHRAFNVMPFGAKRNAPLFVQATRWVFAFTACPSTSHHALQKNSGAEAPEDLAHRLRLNLAAMGCGAMTRMRERVGLNAAPALARLAASVMHGVFAVNGANVLHVAGVVVHDVAAMFALGTAAALGAHCFGFRSNFIGRGAIRRVVVKITLGVVFAVVHFPARFAMLADVMRAMNASGGDFMNAVVLVVFAVGHCPVP